MGATLPERRHELVVPYLSERPHEVARHFIILECKNRSGATSRSDDLRSIPAPKATSGSDVPRSLRFNYLVELMINQGPFGHLLCTFYTF
ncbi:hypothetical protein F2Q68_00045378 [Brassica cretica]|uniref:Uncharacterized protein n=1 Tax=Brassica cretica TaxID=69181 RepID=A0A8S9LNN6_BRACR|nr:hypothetical protein F2Q68_00045378 [Brassica cretica]